MFNILLAIHDILCVILMGLVLIQQGKGADMGAAFGGNSTTLFGAAGAADFLTKLTTGIAIAFMVSSILLVRAYSTFETAPEAINNVLEGSVMGGEAPPAAAKDAAPAVEVAPAAKQADAAKTDETKGAAAPAVEAKPAPAPDAGKDAAQTK